MKIQQFSSRFAALFTMKISRFTKALLAVALLLPTLPLLPTQAVADSYTVVPPKFELIGNPGDIITEKIKIRNDGDSAATYQVEVEDFTASGDDGSIELIDPETPRTTFSLAEWITVEPSQFTVPSLQERTIDVSIRIPQDGEPGGHYASVLIKRSGQPTPGGAAVDTRIGSLFLLRVSGNVTEKAEIESFSTSQSIAQHGPITFRTRYANEGNVHIQPTGTIVVTNIFGKKVKEIPITPVNVLPGSARLTTVDWDEKNLIGRYTATLVVDYGQSGQKLTASTSFIVFPLYLLGIIIGLILIGFFALKNRKKLKRIINRLTSD